MSSEKPKGSREQDEERLYEPIKKALCELFSYHYSSNKKILMREPLDFGNPHLEITAHGVFSEKLKRAFDDEALSIFSTEKIRPDIMGFVWKESSSQKELITVEVKDEPIKIVHVSKAKLYQDLFNATFSLLVSTQQFPEQKLRVLLNKDAIRGKVIIARYMESPHRVHAFEIKPRLKDSIPEPFKRFCKS